MRVADAVNKIEGVPVRSYAIELSKMKEALLNSHMEMARRVK